MTARYDWVQENKIGIKREVYVTIVDTNLRHYGRSCTDINYM